jgi:hypothetical protein
MLQKQINSKRAIGHRICEQLRAEIGKLGFVNDGAVSYPYYDTASFVLTQDPYTSDVNLTGYWYNERNKRRVERIGHLQFNSDGSFYAEYDVVKPHPTKSQWFVDVVVAWGKDEMIKSEPKLLPTLAESESA